MPTRNSEWSGTGTVTVVSGSFRCITIWLPRLLASTKPCLARMRLSLFAPNGTGVNRVNLVLLFFENRWQSGRFSFAKRER